MDQKSQTALNQARSSIWFDLETTGRGQLNGKGPALKAPVGIWQMYAENGEYGNLIYGKPDVPFEKEALDLFGDEVKKITGTEKSLVEHFGKLIKEKPGAVLRGFNIGKFDIPVMAQAFERYGMHEELAILKNMTVDDVQLTASKFLEAKLGESTKKALGLSFKDNATLGTKLENMGEALGVIERRGDQMVFTETGRVFSAHQATDDVTLAKMVHSTLNDPVKASNAFSLKRWIASVDRTHTGKVRTWQSAWLQAQREGIDLEKDTGDLTADAYETTTQRVELKQIEKAVVKDPVPAKPSIKSTGLRIKEAMASKEAQAIKDKLKKVEPHLPRIAKWGLIGAGGMLAIKAIQSYTNDSSHKDGYIPSSVLGKDEDEMLEIIKGSKDLKSFNKRIKKTDDSNVFTKQGDQVHKLVEDEIGDTSEGYASEYEVRDDELGINGIIDVVVKKDGHKIPIEVKSTSSAKLAQMASPDKAHASQANFYAHALQSPGGYLMYVAADDTSKRKTFYVPYSPGTLIRDVADFRSTLLKNKELPGALFAWAKQSQDYWESSALPAQTYTQYTGNNSKIIDQRSKYNHLYPLGSNHRVQQEENGSRYLPRN